MTYCSSSSPALQTEGEHYIYNLQDCHLHRIQQRHKKRRYQEVKAPSSNDFTIPEPQLKAHAHMYGYKGHIGRDRRTPTTLHPWKLCLAVWDERHGNSAAAVFILPLKTIHRLLILSTTKIPVAFLLLLPPVGRQQMYTDPPTQHCAHNRATHLHHIHQLLLGHLRHIQRRRHTQQLHFICDVRPWWDEGTTEWAEQAANSSNPHTLIHTHLLQRCCMV